MRQAPSDPQAVAGDERPTPPNSTEDSRTLPARLESYRANRAPRFSKSWLVLGSLAAAAAVFALLH